MSNNFVYFYGINHKDNLFFQFFDWSIIQNINCYLSVYTELFLILSLSFIVGFLVIVESLYNQKIIMSTVGSNLLILMFGLMLLLLNNTSASFYSFDHLLVHNDFTVFILNIVLISIISCIYISYSYLMVEKIIQYEYSLLLGLAVLGIFTIVNSNDLITLYLGIELQSLSFYILSAFKIHNNFSTEAGLKYFILGAFSSGLLLFGCSLIYGFTGTTNFYDLYLLFVNKELPDDLFKGILLGSTFLTIGLLFKIGAAPFHMWLPDVYEGVPTSLTAIFSIVPKIALFSLFLRLSLDLFVTNYYYWHQILLYSSICSIIIGTLGALYQVKIKKLLAYSAISHVGFLLIGLVTLSNLGVFALFFYLVVYIVMSLNVFAVILSIRKQDNLLKFKKISEFVILFKSNKLLAVNLAIILFSIAGIPPLIGFYSKFYIFIAAVKSEIYLIALIAAVVSVIASMYYIRLIKLMFFKNFEYWTFFTEITKKNSMVISITFIINVLFFCYPEILVISLYNIILNFLYV